ncbi:hypothetical protein HDA44_003244 [Kribbella solani]|uniref:Uncharacterized protein n=1 Tax=Kribbella solani TaxID=236067 RepID=A0A841DML6_9ACTN|nr:hypothetical protein [Kribbella solani]
MRTSIWSGLQIWENTRRPSFELSATATTRSACSTS